MNTIVLGLGKSGLSACHFLLKEGHRVIACDDKLQTVPEGVTFKSPQELQHELAGIDLLVISPGVPPSHPVFIACRELGIETYCDVELAFRKVQKKPPPMCGITGSNGKTTTTMLTAHMLTFANIKAKTAGNIGLPILNEIETAKEHLVIELSSFQLETMKTPVLDAGIILNITPNHLDRHKDLAEYTDAKFRLELCVKEGGEFWVSQRLKNRATKGYTFGFNNSCDLYTDTKEIIRYSKKEAPLPQSLQGTQSHNVENFLAAYALARHYGADPQLCVAAYASFEKPKHRLQFVKSVNQIDFYDDSKATSVDAVLRAVESLSKPIVLIAGGVHKGYPYKAWQEPFAGKVRHLVLLGQAAPFIEQDLQGFVPITHAKNFDDAFQLATSLAQPHEIVLLSPGCSSYDMFSSFEERGKKFQHLISTL